MAGLIRTLGGTAASAVLYVCVAIPAVRGDEPPALNPFGPAAPQRDDAVPGCVELSDGSLHPGRVYLTRDARLKVFDDEQKRQREVPLSALTRVDCVVQREWLEKEWRFKENANDEKVYTGRSYPAREYTHTITLHDGRTIRGPISGIVYVQPEAGGEPERFLLHKSGKGPVGTGLKSLVYVRSVRVGDDARGQGKRQPARPRATPATGQSTPSTPR